MRNFFYNNGKLENTSIPGRLTARRLFMRYLVLMGGLFVVANGIVFTIRADLGVNPWDVFHIGVANQTRLSIGRVIQVTGLLLIAISYLFKVKIFIGTLLNMIFLGLFVDLIIGWGYVPSPGLLWLRLLLFLAGVILFGFGVAFYLSPNLGAGPRDGLMLALTKVTRFRAGMIRTFLEVTAAAVGFILGGPLGIGTVVFALTVGFFMEMGFSFVHFLQKTALFKLLWVKQ